MSSSNGAQGVGTATTPGQPSVSQVNIGTPPDGRARPSSKLGRGRTPSVKSPRPRPGQTDSTHRVRATSRSPRRVDYGDDDDLECSVLDSELSSINDGWQRDQPGHGCNLETLRWYIIRELGEIHQHVKATDKAVHNHHVRLEIMKMKMFQKPNKEELDKCVKRNLVDYYSKDYIDQVMQDSVGKTKAGNDVMTEQLKGHENKINEMYKMLTEGDAVHQTVMEKLKVFENDIHNSFQQVKCIEQDLSTRVGLGFSNFSTLALGLRQDVDSLNSSINS